MTASAVQLACTDFGIWCSDVNSTADSSRVACHYSLPQTDENALKGGACLCGCSHKVCSPQADPSHNARRQANQKVPAEHRAFCPGWCLGETQQHHEESLGEVYCFKASFCTVKSAKTELIFDHMLWNEKYFRICYFFWLSWSGHPTISAHSTEKTGNASRIELLWLQQHE